MSRKLVAPLLLALMLPAFAIGWRTPASSSGLVSPVNMTLADNRLFVSDRYIGVLVYDITDPAAPALITTIPLQGNEGTALKDGVLYANERDLLHVLKPTETGYEIVATLKPYYEDNGGEYEDVPNPGFEDSSGFACACATSYDTAPQSSPGPRSSSYATFALVGDFLYRVDFATLIVYDVSIAEAPEEVERRNVGWEIETIFPANDHLFIGGTRGMYIYGLETPAQPRQISQIEHVRACDPVVVSGPVAYVTLRGNDSCGGATNELLCVDIAVPTNPRLLAQKPMTSPHGLAVREPFLYVSHGTAGYSLVDITNPTMPATVATWPGVTTRDFIWDRDRLYVLGTENWSIYDVSNPRSPTLIVKVAPSPL